MPIQRSTHTNVHRSFLHNGSKLQTTQMFINTWINKLTMAYLYNGILLDKKMEQNSDKYNKNESQNHFTYWKGTDMKQK